jgi:hypothetical protein
MGKGGGDKQSQFRPGTHGGCEALLYEFRDRPRFASGTSHQEMHSESLGGGPVRVAAIDFEDAFAHLRKNRPDFRVDSVRCIGLIELSSGSPLD